MSMTPAEMREMAAKVAEDADSASDTASYVYDGGAGSSGYEKACRDIAAAIRAIPIPDTTAADDAADAEVEKIMEMTDAEVDAALRAEGKDPEKVAEKMRKTIDRVLIWHDTLEKAREGLLAMIAEWDKLTRSANENLRRACEALAAIDAAKAKGGG